MKTIYQLSSGFVFDANNMFGASRLQEDDFKQVAAKAAAAAQGLAAIRQNYQAKGHLSKDGTPEPVCFTRLPFVVYGNPNTPATLQALLDYGAYARENFDIVIFCGIGGSYLGNKVLLESLGQQSTVKVVFAGNNLDGTALEAVLAEAGKYKRVALIPISKSGTTIEPTVAFLYLYNELNKVADLHVEVAVVTDASHQEGPFNKLAQRYGWPLFDVPEGVGGRFSVLANPGLITAVVLGLDVPELLRGAAEMEALCQSEDWNKNPALFNALTKYLAGSKYGADIEVFMPYAMNLRALGEWYVQLLAESLGKRCDRQGRIVCYGRTPMVAVGSTDMHAQTQQHQDGKRNKIIQFVEIGSKQGQVILEHSFTDIPEYAHLQGLDLDKALKAALYANQEALSSDERFNARYYLPKLNEYYLGQMFYFLMLSVAYEGELANVDAYDQPGVEIYKEIMHKKLQ